ncbi:alkaline ceramidase ydc1 [Coemansia sp. RSA 922]|nr:alkaline ceramidase ydc1 [Coemansia sp. S2]KAJ2105687.1 alkaline ceramidase ydc1 [Coemansia sp. RSA 922]
MTLQYQWQLADELPTDVKAGTDVYVSLALFAYSTIVTLVYLHIRKPVFHQVAYGIEIFVVLVRSTMHQIEIRKSNLRAYAEMQQLFGLGVAAFGVAFALWNIDNIYCNNLRAIRNALPMFLAPFFQLHAYWHIGTAIGCYASIVYQQYLRLVMLGTMDNYRLRKAAFIVPYIDRVRKDE